MFDHPSFDGHEHIAFFADKATGTRGIVAIHSTARGPAMGGCRAWNYPDSAAAVTDALRLSRGMSYKNAVAGLPLGGGKAVLLKNGDAPLDDSHFEAFGDALQQLGGRYITAEDVGVSERNMVAVSRRTSYVTGLPQRAGGSGVGGDPSPHTALGVYLGVRAAVKARLDRADLAGVTVAVQGLGSVGRNLCMHLHEAGAKLIVSDINPMAVRHVCDAYGATAVPVEDILTQQVDVIAPCALGAIFDAHSIRRIHAKVIAGGANNQLCTEADGQHLFDAGILYAPDYVINAGGIISVGLEYLGETDPRVVSGRVTGIGSTLDAIFAESRMSGRPTHLIADEMARQRLGMRSESLTRAA